MATRYINWNDVVDRYSQLGKLANVSTHYVPIAEDFVDGALAPAFAIPFASTPAETPNMIRDLVIDITYLKAGNVKIGDAEKFAERIDKTIEKLLTGNMVLISGSGTALERAGEPVWSSTQSYHSVFALIDVKDFKIDTDQLDAQYSERDLEWW